MLRHVKLERVSLQNHPELDERWVQAQIAESPAMLGLGDLDLKDKERIQPHAGRLDLLLQTPDATRRYEVEIQLGATDESHIIRTIEYWDIERKRYPQYDHCAVLVAEDITSRFLNVVNLFNGAMPLIAIQMQGLKINSEEIALVFTTVMDELVRGADDEEPQEGSDRGDWERRSSEKTMGMVDQLLHIVQEFDPALKLKYNKHTIGLTKDGRPRNVTVFRPWKNTVLVTFRLPQSMETLSKLEESGLEVHDYFKPEGGYRVRLSAEDLDQRRDVLRELIGMTIGHHPGE